jgi:hypothetical protein
LGFGSSNFFSEAIAMNWIRLDNGMWINLDHMEAVAKTIGGEWRAFKAMQTDDELYWKLSDAEYERIDARLRLISGEDMR